MARSLRDIMPRHTRGYLWISFLVLVFLMMALSENGLFSSDNILPNPSLELRRSNQKTLKSQGEFPHAQYELEEDTASSTSTATKLQHTTPGIPPKPLPTSTAEKAPTSKSGTSTKPESKASPKTKSQTFNGLSPNDVVILVKTGATSIWRRMPAHMSTTLSSPLLTPNILLYSDTPDSINGLPVIDVLANISSTLKSTPDFELYNKAKEIKEQNLYLESGSMEGDAYLPGGWRLDKYKFVPMFEHAEREMRGRGVKWYVYMEDDNYFFWPTLYAWLGTLDHTKPMMVGSPAFRLGEDFAHGGSGFAISGKAMEVSFGAEEGLSAKFEDYAKEQCCGDQVLSHVLREKGVERYTKLDGGGWAALQSLPQWRIGFGTWNWCSPIMNVHKVHQADVSRLFVFERDFMRKNGVNGRIRYKDVFEGFAKGNIVKEERSEWDNYAAAKTFASSYDPDTSGEGKRVLGKEELAKKPWYSKEACKKACVEWEQCLSWKYADDNCGLDHTAAMGQKIDAGIRMESGWMLERIRKLEGLKCEKVDF